MAKAAYLTDAASFIETWLNHYFPSLNLPSLSLAIAQDGKVVYRNAWGYADIQKKEKATPDHIYRVASHSKSFTSFLVAMLIDEGKLKLDEPIITYVPWLKPNKAYAEVTLRHVLSHSTGTQRDGDNSTFWELKGSFPTKQDMKAYFLKSKPVIENNTQHKYSNFGYALAAYAIEEVTGEDYNTLLMRKVIAPLKLNGTGPDNPPKGKKIATGYSSPVDGTAYPITPMHAANGLSSVTGVHSTPSDLCITFSAYIFGKAISRRIQKEITHPVWAATPENPDSSWYCLGLGKSVRNKKAYYGHGGGYPGFITRTTACPELGITVSLCTNGLNADTLSLVNTIYDLLWFFKNERGTSNPLTKYESPFYSVWYTAHTLAANKKLKLTWLKAANPLTNCLTLELTKKPGVFTIQNVDGNAPFAEPAVITLKHGKPTHMQHASNNLTPSKEEYLRHLKTLGKA